MKLNDTLIPLELASLYKKQCMQAMMHDQNIYGNLCRLY